MIRRDGWTLEASRGPLLARCEALSAVPGVAHAFGTRLAADGAPFDVGPADGPDRTALSYRSALVLAAGLRDGPAAILRQVHGARIVEAATPREPEEADAVWAPLDSSRCVCHPAIRTADCVPILLVDREGRVAAAVHAGWRGTAAGIARAAVAHLVARGVKAADLVAAIGPAIGGCCYEVGDDVAGAVAAASSSALSRGDRGGSGPTTIDLRSANRAQLADAGVPARSIHVAPWCTRCRNDLFFSVRAEGERAGRQMAVIGLAARP